MIDFAINYGTISLDSKVIDYPKFSYISNIMLSYLLWYLTPNQKKKEEEKSPAWRTKKIGELMITTLRGKYDFEKIEKLNNLNPKKKYIYTYSS